MAAGLATLELLQEPGFYVELEARTRQLVEGLLLRAQAADIALNAHYRCGMFGLFFTEQKFVSTYEQVMACDKERFNQFFHGMLERGVYFAPSAFEAGFISIAHGSAEIEQSLIAAKEVFKKMKA